MHRIVKTYMLQYCTFSFLPLQDIFERESRKQNLEIRIQKAEMRIQKLEFKIRIQNNS